MPLSKEQAEAFLREPHIAVLATVRPDGRPHVVPTWYEYDNGEVVLHMSAASVRYGNIQHNNRVALCMDTRTPPYKAVIVEGSAGMEEGTDDERTRRMAVHYLGEARGNRYADSLRGASVVIARVKPDRFISWDYGS
jgi:PPOX class probable F420-dependent enzyme